MMKKIFQITILLLSGLVLFQSCTKVDEPYYTVKAVYVDTTRRSVLLEDYTGHLCVNCAPAATIANTIQELYHGQVFVIAVHAGIFARPNPVQYPPYLAADYTCATGNDWLGYSGFNIDGNPKGMVNRRPYSGNISFGPSDWNQAVQSAVGLSKVAIMTVHNTFSSQSKLMNTSVAVKFLQNHPGKVNLTVCIIEDSIYGGQLNNIKPDSIPIIKNFRFMHMLRGSLNGSWGEQIAENPGANEIFSKPYSFDFSTESWVPKHCSVIAFISDAGTREVLHVMKSPVINP
jgi:hypothetical protein